MVLLDPDVHPKGNPVGGRRENPQPFLEKDRAGGFTENIHETHPAPGAETVHQSFVNGRELVPDAVRLSGEKDRNDHQRDKTFWR